MVMNKLFASLLISGALLSGCASNNKISEDKYSGFLSDYSILKVTPNDKDTLGYVNRDVNWQKYNSVMVDKVVVITPDGDTKTDGKLLVAIADKFHELIVQKLSDNFTAVNTAGSGTIRIQPAITSVFTSYDDLKGYQYIPVAAAVTGARRAGGGEKQSARVMSEIKMIDSVDGELLAQAVDLKAGGKVQDEKSGVLLADVKPILEQWAQRIDDRITSLQKAVKNK
jgi:hypothetical protein